MNSSLRSSSNFCQLCILMGPSSNFKHNDVLQLLRCSCCVHYFSSNLPLTTSILTYLFLLRYSSFFSPCDIDEWMVEMCSYVLTNGCALTPMYQKGRTKSENHITPFFGDLSRESIFFVSCHIDEGRSFYNCLQELNYIFTRGKTQLSFWFMDFKRLGCVEFKKECGRWAKYYSFFVGTLAAGDDGDSWYQSLSPFRFDFKALLMRALGCYCGHLAERTDSAWKKTLPKLLNYILYEGLVTVDEKLLSLWWRYFEEFSCSMVYFSVVGIERILGDSIFHAE